MGNAQRFYADIMAQQKEVTGSCILPNVVFPDALRQKILIDAGLFQEEKYNSLNKSLPFDASQLDFVFVTHNHVDHIGRLPLLYKNGYRGKIYMSKGTAQLIRPALEDSCKVLRNKSKLNNEPLIYSDEDVDGTMTLIKPVEYNQIIHLTDNIKFCLFPNGHLFGASCILIQIKYRDSSGTHYEDINLFFSGDYNNKNLLFDVPPIPKWVCKLPVTFIQEATYGNMDSNDIEYVFEENILSAIKQRKEVIIPVFSLGRSQEIMYILKNWQKEGKLDKSIPIYYDGKLLNRYTQILLHGDFSLKDKDLLPENSTFVSDSEMRNSIMNDGKCKIILTTSGMGTYGPAQTYIPEYLKRENALIHFVGYCAEGTLGRRLYECAFDDIVEVSGLQIKKKAQVLFTSEFSAHAKADELLQLASSFENIRLLLVNHGEVESKATYSKRAVEETNAKNVGILGLDSLGRDYCFRVNGYGYLKSFSSKFI